MVKRSFASDNYAGVHPSIMRALHDANAFHATSYGGDPWTAKAIDLFRSLFGNDTQVFFVYNGTGANVLGLKAITKSFNSILCSELAHINVDESTAPELFTGCKLIGVPHEHGKITPAMIERKILRLGDQHHPQAKVISISQTTEYATVYTVDEIKAISALAKKYDMYLHMDGSRIANAAASLGTDFKAFTCDAGVDVLSFGGTKNGMMFGEAVLFFNAELSKAVPYYRKQAMQLHSKMRFISAQFVALLSDNIWQKNARHANAMAAVLYERLRDIKGVQVTHPVEANGLFAIFPPAVVPALQEEFFFYVWNEEISEVRLMCSFDTEEKDVVEFCEKLSDLLNASA
jgi:threonine aldolase